MLLSTRLWEYELKMVSENAFVNLILFPPYPDRSGAIDGTANELITAIFTFHPFPSFYYCLPKWDFWLPI